MKRLLPNFITLCNGFFGIISIIAILNDQINVVPYFSQLPFYVIF